MRYSHQAEVVPYTLGDLKVGGVLIVERAVAGSQAAACFGRAFATAELLRREGAPAGVDVRPAELPAGRAAREGAAGVWCSMQSSSGLLQQGFRSG